MKAHRYQVIVYEGIMDKIHSGGTFQNRIYVPRQCVIGYGFLYEHSIDFVSTKTEALDEAQNIVKGNQGVEGRYLGEIELPDSILEELMEAGKKLEEARENLKSVGRELIDFLD
ncbi:hypothetical protein COU57_03135 [Candidatus Pacearchaeota archaeon CG10_big_fil_rev_8_21_14_0_10_32_14]|nr:MAG: hypothetical protein COU57_03135 [Candidatus Pacearchaeota archaeon CG10_big_fil_rev_8_21_14_0_10_32_14]